MSNPIQLVTFAFTDRNPADLFDDVLLKAWTLTVGKFRHVSILHLLLSWVQRNSPHATVLVNLQSEDGKMTEMFRADRIRPRKTRMVKGFVC